jgi:hypothetical protein
MILSFRHRFLFVRARKVAGTSVEIALSTLCGPEDIAPPLISVDERLRQDMGGHCGNYGDEPAFERAFVEAIRTASPEQLARIPAPPSRYWPHMSVTEAETAFGRPRDDFQLVCVERDPYAKVISLLSMRRQYEAYRVGAKPDMAAAIDTLAEDLDEAIARDRLRGLKSISLYAGRTLRILHYESLERDLAAFAADLGLPSAPLPHAKRGPMSNTIDPASVFRRDQMDFLGDYFAEEFATFGYARR